MKLLNFLLVSVVLLLMSAGCSTKPIAISSQHLPPVDCRVYCREWVTPLPMTQANEARLKWEVSVQIDYHQCMSRHNRCVDETLRRLNESDTLDKVR